MTLTPDQIDAARKLLVDAGYTVTRDRASDEVARLARHLYDDETREQRARGQRVGSWENASPHTREQYYEQARQIVDPPTTPTREN